MSSALISFNILGVPFVFQAYMFNLFIFLWLLYGLLVPLDVWTRVRILKFTKTITKSDVMRAGIAEKVQILILMAFLSACAYFIGGLSAGTDCGILCVGSGTVVAIFMALFLITEFSSILENLVEYSQKSGAKVNPVVLLLAKTMGIVYVNLAKRLEGHVNSLNNNNGNT